MNKPLRFLGFVTAIAVIVLVIASLLRLDVRKGLAQRVSNDEVQWHWGAAVFPNKLSGSAWVLVRLGLNPDATLTLKRNLRDPRRDVVSHVILTEYHASRTSSPEGWNGLPLHSGPSGEVLVSPEARADICRFWDAE